MRRMEGHLNIKTIQFLILYDSIKKMNQEQL